MVKVYKPPLCIDCKYYSFDEFAILGEEPQHQCQRMMKKQRSVITGDEVETGCLLTCEIERYGKYSHQCGVSARFFKEKK